MNREELQQWLLAIAAGSLELSRQILEVAKHNLRVNTLTLEYTQQKVELEKELLSSIQSLNEWLKENHNG